MPEKPTASAFMVENHETNRVVIATPIVAETAKFNADDFLLKFRGRLVEAETANSNGAFWSQGDLEFGLPSVAHGPLNWGHDPAAIIGTLVDPLLVSAERAAEGIGPHIQTGAVVWAFLFREKARALANFIDAGQAWFSMECVSNEIACVGPNGCGAVMPYVDAQTRSGVACEHVKERASHRRFVDPVFQGAAVIVPPQAPGWRDANITSMGLQQDAQAQVEAADLHLPGLADDEARQMVASILQWSARTV